MKVFISRKRTEETRKYLEDNSKNIIKTISDIFNCNPDNITITDPPDVENYLDYAMDVDIAIFGSNMNPTSDTVLKSYGELFEKERIIKELNFFLERKIPTIFI